MGWGEARGGGGGGGESGMGVGSGGWGGVGGEESIDILFPQPIITRNKHLFPRSYCNRKLVLLTVAIPTSV